MISISYSIVQIQATRFHKGEKVYFQHLEYMIPDHSCWEDLTSPLGGAHHEHDIFLIDNEDSVIEEDVIGLEFCGSVGDWPDGYNSSFDHEVDMIGVDDLVSNHMSDIIEDVKKKFKPDSPRATIVTLWETEAFQDHDGEYDSSIHYVGVFDIKRVKELIL